MRWCAGRGCGRCDSKLRKNKPEALGHHPSTLSHQAHLPLLRERRGQVADLLVGRAVASTHQHREVLGLLRRAASAQVAAAEGRPTEMGRLPVWRGAHRAYPTTDSPALPLNPPNRHHGSAGSCARGPATSRPLQTSINRSLPEHLSRCKIAAADAGQGWISERRAAPGRCRGHRHRS